MFSILRLDLRNPEFAGVSVADRYAAALDMAEWADRRGVVAVTLSEHHSSDDDYLPSPLVMAGAIAARTTNIAISINALIAPFHDPLRLAEDIAVIDQLSRGRFSCTIAGGYAEHEFEMFGVDLSERPARVRETVATLRAAWTGEPFDFRGRTAMVRPRPFQASGPPIALGGSSEPAARRAARIGDGFIPSNYECWKYYRDECLKLGKPDPGRDAVVVAEVVVLSEDPDAAWPVLGPYFMHESNSYGQWDSLTGDDQYRVVANLDELRETEQYRILTPDEYAAELAPEGDAASAVLHPMVGGIPPDLAWEHLRLFEETFID